MRSPCGSGASASPRGVTCSAIAQRVIERRRQRQRDLADDLRPHVQRRVGVLPASYGSARPTFVCHEPPDVNRRKATRNVIGARRRRGTRRKPAEISRRLWHISCASAMWLFWYSSPSSPSSRTGNDAEDRARYLRMAVDAAKEVKTAAQKPRPEYESFREALRVRTRYPFVTVAIVASTQRSSASCLFGPTPISNPATLLDWGASVGPRTTNGEWWRLVTSTVLHTSMLHVLVNVAVLLQVGVVARTSLRPPDARRRYICRRACSAGS